MEVMMMMVDIFSPDGASSLFLDSGQKTLGAPVTQQLHGRRRQPEICNVYKDNFALFCCPVFFFIFFSACSLSEVSHRDVKERRCRSAGRFILSSARSSFICSAPSSSCRRRRSAGSIKASTSSRSLWILTYLVIWCFLTSGLAAIEIMYSGDVCIHECKQTNNK